MLAHRQIMHSLHPVEALKHQLDSLCHTAKKGFIRLSTPCQVGNLMGWLSVQSVYPASIGGRVMWALLSMRR